MAKVVCKMKLSDETKGALIVRQVSQDGVEVADKRGRGDDGGLVGTQYLRKAHLKGDRPEEVTVTVEW